MSNPDNLEAADGQIAVMVSVEPITRFVFDGGDGARVIIEVTSGQALHKTALPAILPNLEAEFLTVARQYHDDTCDCGETYGPPE